MVRIKIPWDQIVHATFSIPFEVDEEQKSVKVGKMSPLEGVEMKPEFKKWMDENIHHGYSFVEDEKRELFIEFTDENEAMLFKLVYGG